MHGTQGLAHDDVRELTTHPLNYESQLGYHFAVCTEAAHARSRPPEASSVLT
jgi:hypothetical protein